MFFPRGSYDEMTSFVSDDIIMLLMVVKSNNLSSPLNSNNSLLLALFCYFLIVVLLLLFLCILDLFVSIFMHLPIPFELLKTKIHLCVCIAYA